MGGAAAGLSHGLDDHPEHEGEPQAPCEGCLAHAVLDHGLCGQPPVPPPVDAPHAFIHGLLPDHSPTPRLSYHSRAPPLHHEGHSHGELERGFNLRATEIAFSASVDPYFDAHLMMTVDYGGGVELEEAYFDTRSLPAGLKLRGGKFLSGIGYLNDQPPHTWDFVDQNLPYRTLLGEHGIMDTGLQFTWRPRTGSVYTLLGVEALQGNEQVFGTAGEEVPDTLADGGAVNLGNGDLSGKRPAPVS